MLMALVPETKAIPTIHVPDAAHALKITSNLEPRIRYESQLGPFIIGKDLNITCSSENSVSLAWLEEDVHLPTSVHYESGITSVTFDLGTLRAKDSGRHLTCRDQRSGAEKSVDLHLINDSMKIRRNGHLLRNRETVAVKVGTNSTLDCIVYGSKPSTGYWWEGDTKLQAVRNKTPTAIINRLSLGPALVVDNGREFTCQARNGQLSQTVVYNVVKEGKEDAPPNSSTIAASKINTTAATASSENEKEAVTPNKSVSAAPKTSIETPPLSSTAVDPKSTITTSRPGSPASEALFKEKMNLIVGGSAIAFIGIAVPSFIIVIVKLYKKIDRMSVPSSAPHEGNSSELQDMSGTTSEQSTLESLDPNDLPAVTPLLARPPPVDEGSETARSGGRMSVAMLDDRDHSYYYPDLINNSYYYPKISDDVRANILKENTNI